MSAIDLSLMPPPDVVETIDFETIVAAVKADFVERYPDAAATIDLESDPAAKLIEAFAYRELLLRARVNDAARAVMLASAGGADLDNLAALYGVTRLVLDPGNPDAVPPVAATYEADADLRYRTQLAVDGFSTAGPAAAYRFHALSSSGDVLDVGVDSPTPGQVRVTVLGADGDGVPSADLLATVAAALTAESVRPLTDEVVVEAATITPYVIDATLVLYPGPAAAPVVAAAQAAAEAYVAATRKLGYDIVRSGLFAALHQPGVQRVTLTSPAADIVCDARTATYCTGIAIAAGADPDV